MPSAAFQALKKRAREELHDRLSREASVYENAADDNPDTMTVRYHDELKPVGDLAGTNLSYAETAERPARCIFLVEELVSAGVSLDRGFLVVFSTTEGYFVDNVHPKDGITQSADVSPMRTAELTGKTLPDGTVIA